MSVLRSFYANLVTARAGVRDPVIRSAFSTVDRAAHVGPGPWKIFTPVGYVETPNDDEAFLYQDVAVALAPERSINNGEPSLHARCIAAAEVRPGDRVLHVGAGTGYYSAILAHLVGESGCVEAYEVEPDLASKAAANLASMPQVNVHCRSAVAGPLPESDVIYVNAGVTHPPAEWLDALRANGRLILPLIAQQQIGILMLVTRANGAAYRAKVISGVGFIPCAGAWDDAEAQTLMDVLSKGGHMAVRSLRRGVEPDETAWLSGCGWWFSTREPD